MEKESDPFESPKVVGTVLESLQKYYCDVCKKQCTDSYDVHVLDRVHQRKVRIAKLEERVANAKESVLCSGSKLIQTNLFSMIRKISTTNKVRIINTNKPSRSFSTGLLEASGWQRDVDKPQLLNDESEQQEKEPHADSSTTEKSETHQDRYKICVICDKIFDGPIAFEEHLQGACHKKKTETTFLRNVADSTLHTSVKYNTGAVPKYYCTTCKKQCTDRIQYNEHILSEVHIKNKRKAKISAYVNN
ncbi:hypothetical protein TNCV_680131 [Trichonephila clavipes]|nr:hypothetical protein TNCV_680131 [Trichonephila clavipes]